MNSLQSLRTDMGLNIKEAAQALDMPYTTYVNYEKGDQRAKFRGIDYVTIAFS